MAMTALAPSNTTGRLQQPQDPFATPSQVPIQSPPPCAHPTNSQYSNRVLASYHDDSGYEPATRIPVGYGAYKSSSLSSGGSSSLMSPMSSIDLEKGSTGKEPRRSQQDPEKAMYKARRDSPQHHPGAVDLGRDNASLALSEADDGLEDAQQLQEQNAVKILLFLSGPCVLLSAANAIWAVISVIITLFTQPVRLCARRPTFGLQLSGLLGPALNLHLKSIYTPLPPHVNEDRSYHPWTLVMVHLASPFLSLGMMFMAWVLAAYWVSSAVVGDPAGMDKRDDGRETVLGLRRWWEKCLMRSVKDE